MNIKSGRVLPKDSGIGKLINLMKAFDEPLYDKTLEEYKEVLKEIDNIKKEYKGVRFG